MAQAPLLQWLKLLYSGSFASVAQAPLLQWLKLLISGSSSYASVAQAPLLKCYQNVTKCYHYMLHIATLSKNLKFYCVVHQRSYVTDPLPNVTVVTFADSIRFRFTVQAYDVPIVILTIGSGLRFRFTVPAYDVPIVIVTIGTG